LDIFRSDNLRQGKQLDRKIFNFFVVKSFKSKTIQKKATVKQGADTIPAPIQ